jgi:tetratricopeptide (TPR) repeat protein
MLADPELELLRDLLREDPGAWVFVDVAVEVARRGDHAHAITILYAGIERCPRRADAWDALGQVCPTASHVRKAIAAFLEIVGVEGHDEALANAYVALQERLAALRVEGATPIGAAPRQQRATDLSLSADRAEAYANLGRPDRAIRVYRRLVRSDPSNRHWSARLSALLSARDSTDGADFDLSGEMPSPDHAPIMVALRPNPLQLGATQPDHGGRVMEPATPVAVTRRFTARVPSYGLPEDAPPRGRSGA